MDLSKKISKAVKAGKLYNLEHFHNAWENEDLRRLMGNELLFPPSPRVIEAVTQFLPKMNYYPEDPATNKKLLQALADYAGVAGGDDPHHQCRICRSLNAQDAVVVEKHHQHEGDTTQSFKSGQIGLC